MSYNYPAIRKTKYRISRRQKKREKKELIRLTDRDMKEGLGYGLTKKEKKALRYERWIMLGVVYHQYNFHFV